MEWLKAAYSKLPGVTTSTQTSSPPPPPPAAKANPLPKPAVADSLTLEQATDRVNMAKAAYDACETARMTATMNGAPPEQYSCEREFVAFTKAFDIQLLVEAKRI